MPRPALRVKVSKKDQAALKKLLSGGMEQVRVVLRAVALQRLAEGMGAPQIAEVLPMTRQAVRHLVDADHCDPLNLGTDVMVSINELVELVAAIAGKTIFKTHDLSKPQGVRGRNSDNQRLQQVLGWQPSISLEEGLAVTYAWISDQLRRSDRLAVAEAAVTGSSWR